MSTFRKLIGEIKPVRRYFIISMVAGIMMSAASSQLAILTKTLFDALETKDAHMIKVVPLFIAGLALINAVSRYYSTFYNTFMADCITVSLRKRLQKKFLNLNLTYHNTFEAGHGGLLSRVLNDVSMIEQGMRMVSDFFREPVLFVFLLGWMFYLDWRLTACLILILPPLSAFLRNLAKSLRKYNHIAQRELEGVTTQLKESLDGVRVIQSFNLEDEMANRFDQVSQRYLQTKKKIQSRSEVSGPVTEFLATIVIAVLFTYLGLKITNGTASLGDFASYLASILMLQKPIKTIQETYIKFQNSIVAADRVYQILEDTSHVSTAANPKPFPKTWNTIEYKNVSFRYGDKWVLKNFNLTIHRGEVVALVGESGSGKSTAVNLLERFFDPTEGEIFVDGVPLRDLELQSLRQNVALVTQDVFLFNDSISYNIQTGNLERPTQDVLDSAKAANAHAFISTKPDQYKTKVGDRGGLLSGGEKQRVSIARAFFKDSPILILDEATSALDSASEVEVQRGLESLMQGRTVLVIAHRLSTVVNSDKIVVLKDGEIVESGSHQELLSRQGEYFRFKTLQST